MSSRKTRRTLPPAMPASVTTPISPASTVAPAAAASVLPAVPPPDKKAELDALIVALEQTRGSRVLVYWTTDLAVMSEGAILSLYDQLTAIGKTSKLDLLLRTNGGQTEVPWRIVSLVREFCDEFHVLIPHKATSSGTLTAMGGDTIVMTPLGVLGPIDPSRTHPLLPKPDGATEGEAISVQDMRHAMQFIREAAGTGDDVIPYTPEAMAQIFTALFDKIHPLAIGAIEQSYALSKLIGTQCLGTHMDPVGEADQIRAIVDRLCDEYKSHQYPISRQEAREIGLAVVDAPVDVEKAMMDVFRFYVGRPFMPSPPPKVGTAFQAQIAWLDSTSLHTQVDADYVVNGDGTFAHRGDKWVVY